MDYEIIRLCDAPEQKLSMARWFHESWGVPLEAYLDSMEACLSGGAAYPQWYVAVARGRIVGGLGVIENDFHDRPELRPNVCAVYTQPDCRGRGIAGALLAFVCEDMHRRGVDTLYLSTNHDSFYERYGWQFFCMAHEEGEPTRLYIHRYGQQA